MYCRKTERRIRMTRNEQKRKAQELIMDQLAKIAYGQPYDDFVRECFGDLSEQSLEEANALLSIQMDRVAKLFGYEKSWFY